MRPDPSDECGEKQQLQLADYDPRCSVHFRAAHTRGSSPFFEQKTLTKAVKLFKLSKVGRSSEIPE